MKKGMIIVALFAVFFISTLSAHAALELRGTDSQGYRLIYDTDRNITWYDYSNYVDKYVYIPGWGYSLRNNWQSQMDWASGLTVTFNGAIYDDWRLPTALNPDGTGPCYDPFRQSNCTFESEMGHLFYTELGNKRYPQEYALEHRGDFQNLLANRYWSNTEYDEYYAWNFDFMYGDQFYYAGKTTQYYAIAVRSGDVAVVPEPISSILFVTGGALLAGWRYIRRRNICLNLY